MSLTANLRSVSGATKKSGVRIQLKDGSGAPVTDISGKPIYTWQLLVRQFNQ